MRRHEATLRPGSTRLVHPENQAVRLHAIVDRSRGYATSPRGIAPGVSGEPLIDLAALERELRFENERLAESLLEPLPDANEVGQPQAT